MLGLFHLQVAAPWKPEITSDGDTKYIPDEFACEPVELTPPTHDLGPITEAEEMPYFESFSYHGSRGSSLGSYLSHAEAAH
jgi:hypothetical protein